jgi:prephenate dehydrogenase
MIKRRRLMIRIAIVGMGLIGTSVGMALRTANERDSPLGKITVVGFDPDRRRTSEARGRLAIDQEATSLAEAVRDANLILVAAPVQAIQEIFRSLATLASPGAVITDVASTKSAVMEWARELLPTTVNFVGGHPMAGREQSGPAAADPNLFQKAVYCLCPATSANEQAIALVEALVQQVGAKVYYVDPIEHDAYVAAVSHLPFLLSAGLIEVTSHSPGWREMSPLAATGFRDISRLASGDPAMHRDICITNAPALMRWIDDTMAYLLDVREWLEQGREAELLAMFQHARDVREQWLESKPHMRPGESDFENLNTIQVERPSLFGRRNRPSPSDQDRRR